MSYNNDLNTLAINTLSINGIAAVNKANSGHPGIVLGAAPIIHTLFTKHLVFDPKNPTWVNRDRFILSAGHGSALLYSALRLLGLISQTDLEQFRQLDSKTPGHPEFGHTKGVEATTGPLGQGIATAAGLAIAEKHLNSLYPELSHYTYVLCGDGDLQEGVAFEALALIGHLKLNKYILIHDSNDIQLDTPVNKVDSINHKQKMEAFGFNYIFVDEATVDKIDAAIIEAKASTKPTFIEVKTVIGAGAPKAGTSDVHGAPLGKDFEILKTNLNWTYGDFEVPAEVEKLYQETIFARGAQAFDAWKASPALEKFLTTSTNISLDLELKQNDATRNSSGTVIKYLNDILPNWIGGSADLVASTKAGGADGDFSAQNPKGRNLLFGVREFAMGCIANGLALHSNFRPFVSTFFVFSDYLKAAMRLAALMKLPVTYIFTHDSVFVGEDGPTHEPIEQLAMLRSIPNLKVLRPADEKEVLASYELALQSIETPHAIVLTRQNIVSLANTSKTKFHKGAYLIKESQSPWTLIATGSELANAVKLAEEFDLNVISMSNFDFKQEIFWDIQKAISIEAATTFGWAKFAKFNIGHDGFGYSAPGDLVYAKIGLNYESLKTAISKIIK
ncbi:transketolase [Mycoplasma iguanae]|uniref:Transketolase n=1 Tax=Mycoplasma iguanae TaxID=292461 RepID=A0ABY5R922_9MOLU|nr:transketolase [Mycoplasma iguanae]UVD81993.1 transketolase [Mycoplasma iguanae]